MKLEFYSYKTIAFAAGELSIELGFDPRAFKYYDWGGSTEFRMNYVEKGGAETIESFDSLVKFARARSIDLVSEVSKDPSNWAELLSTVHGMAHPLVRGTGLRGEYYSRLGIKFNEVKPAVSGNFLIWSMLKRDRDEQLLLRVECNLENFVLKTESLRRLRKSPLPGS
jgi:hypothetical protein